MFIFVLFVGVGSSFFLGHVMLVNAIMVKVDFFFSQVEVAVIIKIIFLQMFLLMLQKKIEKLFSE